MTIALFILLLLAGTAQNYVMLATAVTMMFFVFGQIPINDAMIAAYTNEGWRARIYAIKYVVSFSVSAMSVPMVALLYKSSGGFASLFVVLAALAMLSLTAALFYPRMQAAQPAASGV